MVENSVEKKVGQMVVMLGKRRAVMKVFESAEVMACMKAVLMDKDRVD